MWVYSVRVNGKSYRVSVKQSDRRTFQVSMNGETFECHSFRSDSVTAWSIHREDKTLHARAQAVNIEKVDVWLAGTPYRAIIHTSNPEQSTIAEVAGERTISGEIRAAMPGRITTVLVKPDDAVASGTPLLILESMKMQNEIVAPKSGRVKSVLVKDGATVRKDTLMIEIE
jgi:biotin carboxyl carrier protein